MTDSFKHFLLTEGRTQTLEEQQALDWIRQNSAKYASNLAKANTTGIYRGTRTNEQYLYGNPTSSTRYSAHDSNEYTLLLSNLPEWESYPPRGQSFICSSSSEGASAYASGGATYYVFPADSTIVGVAPLADIWVSFAYLNKQAGLGSIRALNTALQQLYTAVTGDSFKPKNWSELLQVIQQIQQAIDQRDIEDIVNTMPDNSDGRKLLQHMLETNQDSLIQVLKKLLDPEPNNFTTATAKSLGNFGRTRELWFSAPAIFVNTSAISDIRQFVDKALKS